MTGCMAAPFVAVSAMDRAWDLLALLDLGLAGAIGGKRAFWGKPRDWKRKIRGLGQAAAKVVEQQDTTSAGATARPPRTVLATGVAYIFVAQIVQASISCWGFTFAA